MASSFVIACTTLLLLLVSAGAISEQGNRVLVVLEDLAVRDSHSIFFSDLKDRGYKLSFFRFDDSDLVLKKYGKWLYDHAVIFAPGVSTFGKVDAGQILDFIDAGHNVIAATDSSVGPALRLIAKECGVYFDAAGTNVIDHLNFDVRDYGGDHTLLVATGLNPNATAVYGKSASTYGSVLFRGVGQQLDENQNPLLFRVLTAAPSAYSANVNDVPKEAQVGRTVLLSALQARNNARVILSGSLEFFSNKFFTSTVQRWGSEGKGVASSNRALAADLSAWALQERAVLKSENVSHHIVGQVSAPQVYRIKDRVRYEVTIREWNGEKWAPFTRDDVQLEFVLLDPYVRTFLKHDGKGHYFIEFTLPDVYGVFTFRLQYERLGYTFLLEKDVVSVRPFRHDEYERFIASAHPYYAGAFSMIVGLFIFSVVFLYNREPQSK